MKYILFAIISLLSLQAYPQIAISRPGQEGMFFPASMVSLPDGGHMISIKDVVDRKNKSKNWNDYKLNVTLVKYDKDFKIVNQVKLPGGPNTYSGHYTELIRMGNRYWFIYLEPLENVDLGNIKAMEIDPVTMETKEPKIIASSSSLNHSISSYSRVEGLLIISKVSPSGKYACLYVRMTDEDFFLSSLDENLNPLWGRKESLEGLETKGISSLEVDDVGAIYFSYFKKKGPGYSIYSPTGRVITNSVNLQAGSAKEILFHPVKNGSDVFVYGTYKEDDNCTGVYKGMMKSNGEMGSISTTAFPASIVEPLKKEGWASTKSKKYGVKPSFNAELKEMEDGTVSLVAEFYTYSGSSLPYLHVGSILNVYFGKSEPLFARAPKYRVGGNLESYWYTRIHEEGSLYYACPYGSKMIFFYFDNPENLSRDIALDAKVVTPYNQILVAAVIDSDGSIKRQTITTQSISSLNTGGTTQPGIIRIPIVIDKADVLANVKIL